MGATARNTLLAAILAVTGLCWQAPRAEAIFHLMMVREVSGGAPGSSSSYVELQMAADGQGIVGGHSFQLYNEAGALVDSCLMGTDVSESSINATILIGDTAVANRDFTCDDLSLLEEDQLGDAGAACFAEASPPDCVSWGGGAFSGTLALPDDAIPYGSALPSAMALRRDVSAGCSTLLEFGDDTNSTPADFDLVARDPTPNSVPPGDPRCLLTVNVGGAGVGAISSSVPGISCPGDCSQPYSGQTVTLTAAPNGASGSTFGAWGGCDTVLSLDCTVEVDVARTVSASFLPPASPVLALSVGGDGAGNVTGTGVSCPGDCSGSYSQGDPVSLTANAAAGSSFAGWTGCPSGAANPVCAYDADLNRTIVATFNALPPTGGGQDPTPVAPAPPRKCKKGTKLKRGKCVKAKRPKRR